MMNKKGVMDQMGSLAITLVIVGLVLTVGFLILAETKDTAKDISNAAFATVTNETVIWSNNSYVALVASGYSSMELDCDYVCNSTSCDVLITEGLNWTCDVQGFYLSDEVGWMNSSMDVTYRYKNATQAYNGTVKTINAMGEIPGWFAIIVIVVIGSILVGLVAIFRNR